MVRAPLFATPLLAICLAAVAVIAHADTLTAEFNGQQYHLDYQDQAKQENGQRGNGLAEFTLQGETVNNWTKLFAYYSFPESGDDPSLMVEEVGKTVKQSNPDANYQTYVNKKGGDAIIDFLTWAPGSDVLEFNVFKYARAEYGPGLVAVQYAQRFKIGELDVEGIRALRARSVEEMAHVDVAQARSYFAQQAKVQTGASEEDEQDDAAPAGAEE
jgi:hypothetical protein